MWEEEETSFSPDHYKSWADNNFNMIASPNACQHSILSTSAKQRLSMQKFWHGKKKTDVNKCAVAICVLGNHEEKVRT